MLRTMLPVLLAVSAPSASESPLATTEWLARRLKDPALVILHVGTQKDYDAGHIPGARLVSLAGISRTDDRGMRLELPPVGDLVTAFGRLGVSDRSTIVVCPGGDPVQSATRVWFTLDYLGLGDRAVLLDGGFSAWQAEGRPISREAPNFEPASFTPAVRTKAVADAAWIRENAGSIVLIDARAPEFYSGESPGAMPRAGHIPGARNIPYSSFLDENRRFQPPATLRSMLDAQGSRKVLVTYCHVGQQATIPYFAARYLGLEVRLYDGSFQDWSSRPELPVEAPK